MTSASSFLWLEAKKRCLEERNVCFGEAPADTQTHIICCTWAKCRNGARSQPARFLLISSRSAAAERNGPLPGLHRARRWCQSCIPGWSNRRHRYCWDRLGLIRRHLLHQRLHGGSLTTVLEQTSSAWSSRWFLLCSSCHNVQNFTRLLRFLVKALNVTGERPLT